MAFRGDLPFLFSGSVAGVILRPRCSAGGEFFCFLPSSSAAASVGGSVVFAVSVVSMMHADGIICAGP
jgi:hypothetical protein